MQLLPDGRNIELKSELTFIDADQVRWSVPPGAIVDGASIPAPFWSVVGSPLVGRYRDASIIHDWYCDIRTRPWQATHKVFYDAMIVSGVGSRQAKIMYFAVHWGGPRWEPRVSHNTGLDAGERYRFEAPEVRDRARTRTVTNPRERAGTISEARLVEKAIALIEAEDPSLSEIERWTEDTSWQV